MDFQITEEQQLIRDAVRKVCADYPDEYWAEKDVTHEFPWEFYNAMAAAGWIGIAIPEAYGGSGRGITEASIVLEEVAASGAAMNGATSLHLSVFGMHPVVNHGGEDLKISRYFIRPQFANRIPGVLLKTQADITGRVSHHEPGSLCFIIRKAFDGDGLDR